MYSRDVKMFLMLMVKTKCTGINKYCPHSVKVHDHITIEIIKTTLFT